MAATAEDALGLTGHWLSRLRQPQDLRAYTLTGLLSQPEWLGWVFKRLTELLDLDEGWDSYGGKSINDRTAAFAYQVLSSPMFCVLPRPDVVPTSIGGIQAGWRSDGRVLEIEFRSGIEMDVYYFDDESPADEEEFRLSVDLTRLRALLEKFAT